MPPAVVRLGVCVTLVCVTASGAQQGEFDRLFERYRGTDATSAIAEFSTWSDERVLGEARLPQPLANDPVAIAALALFHTETGLRRGTFGTPSPRTERWQSVMGREAHYSRSFTLVESLDANPAWRRNFTIARFIDDWFVVAHPKDDAAQRPPSFDQYVRRNQFQNSANVQLMLGMLHVGRIGPRATGGPLGFDFYSHTNEATGLRKTVSAGGETFDGERIREAELAFGQALTVNPQFAEARMRLGRLQQIVNRKRDALESLERAFADAAGDRFTQYLTSLFLGQFHEDAGRVPEALDAYRRAASVEPAGAAALLAAGSLEWSRGDVAAGAATLRRAFDTASVGRDPWTMFEEGHDRDAPRRWARLRALVSSTPPRPAVPSPVQPEATRIAGTRRPVAGGLSVALVLDTSGSTIRGAGPRGMGELASMVVDALQAGDVLSIVTASDRIALVADGIDDLAAARRLLKEIPHRETATTVLWDAVVASRALVTGNPGRSLIFMISDGADNRSWYGRKRALDVLGRAGVIVDAIEVKYGADRTCRICDADYTYGEITLRPATSKTGGQLFLSETEELGQRIGVLMEARRKKKE